MSTLFLLGSRFVDRLDRRGLFAIERFMGMILVTIAIQMSLTKADRQIDLGQL